VGNRGVIQTVYTVFHHFELAHQLPVAATTSGTLIDSGTDHRIAMAFSIAALRATAKTEIRGAEAAAISSPNAATPPSRAMFLLKPSLAPYHKRLRVPTQRKLPIFAAGNLPSTLPRSRLGRRRSVHQPPAKVVFDTK